MDYDFPTTADYALARANDAERDNQDLRTQLAALRERVDELEKRIEHLSRNEHPLSRYLSDKDKARAERRRKMKELI